MTLDRVADLLEGRSDDDDEAAEAYELFGRSVFPYAGVFLSPDVTSEEPLSDVLRAGKARGAWSWVPAFCVALREEGAALGDEVAGVLEAWLSAAPDGDAGRVRAALELGGAAPSLDDADLRDLVDYLGTPCRCGAFFSAAALERIGREVGVPRGFGTRKRLLHQLLIQGSRFDRLPAVLDAFSALVDAHRRRLVGPPWAGQPSAAVWGERLEATGALLGEMRTSFLAEKAAQEASS